METNYTRMVIPALLAIGAAVALGYYWLQTRQAADEEPAVILPVESELVSDVPEEPAHPVYEPEPVEDETVALPPLPPLDDSDSDFEVEIAAVFGNEAVERYITRTGVIDRLVATIDSLPREDLAERIRPVESVGSSPMVVSVGDGDDYLLSPDSYRRYDDRVQMLVTADPAMLAGAYRRYYPLFQQAYADLGYPDGYFNDRLVEVIDHLRATPEVNEPIALVRPHVMYEFANPDLEALSSGQKLLIRIGPENRAAIKTFLDELRVKLTGQQRAEAVPGD